MDKTEINEYLEQAAKIIRQLPLNEKTINSFSNIITSKTQNIPNILRVMDKIRREADMKNPLVKAEIEKAGVYILTAKRLLESAVCICISEITIIAVKISMATSDTICLTALCNNLIKEITDGTYDVKILIEQFYKLNYQFSQMKTGYAPEQIDDCDIVQIQEYMDRTALLLQSLV